MAVWINNHSNQKKLRERNGSRADFVVDRSIDFEWKRKRNIRGETLGDATNVSVRVCLHSQSFDHSAQQGETWTNISKLCFLLKISFVDGEQIWRTISSTWMGNFQHKALMICASVSAYTAPALMTVCLSTNYWIHGEQIRSSSTPIVKVGETRLFNSTYHRIGLWKECVKETIDASYKCDLVKYSKTEAKSEKGFKAVACE